MISIILGTKAQFIKMAPIMVVLEERGLPYQLIDLSQHGRLGVEMLQPFGLSPKVITLESRDAGVDSIGQGLIWIWRVTFRIFFQPSVMRRLIRNNGGVAGVAVVHGDTMSTLLGTLLARRIRLPVALVEAGLRSGRLWSPFPEEFIRRVVEYLSDILFVTGAKVVGHVTRQHPKAKVVDTGYNTGRDALMLMVSEEQDRPESPMPLVTLHRLETITSRTRLERAIRVVLALAERSGRVRFVMHPPTQRALTRFSMLDRLVGSEHVEIQPLQGYQVFVRYMLEAPYIVTDGGSIQEEASYLKKPCLILRDRTERNHGLGDTAYLTSWNPEADWARLESMLMATPPKLRAERKLSAAETVVDTLAAYVDEPKALASRV